ncbi:DUF6377 domain-containing protein [Leeuwenhoekiella aequorea]|uniref:DUF6377 domain-containing protein n=1 Tax=Leeuwenhoekiella TaxID=283735 RepID=UPI00048DC936|nr:DUF6377 domain-containing protein [Leeuwenhoekiella sp. MAR_2009_132]AOE07244.1 conserved hypothetical protein [uncultured bacterium]|tara:strand:- start:13509 stop:15191 length:1683 start_codon:yes stop_codon:yes gene_type:complete
MNITRKLFLQNLVLFFFFQSWIGFSQQNEDLAELLVHIEKSAEYDAIKVERIDSLYHQLVSQRAGALQNRFDLNRSLFFEYRIFKQDSAFKYGIQSKNLAQKLGDKRLIAETTLDLANVCVSAGAFSEALAYLNGTDLVNIPEDIRFSLYGLLGRCYSDMADYSTITYFSNLYRKKAKEYHQKSLELATPDTWDYIMLRGYLNYKYGKLQKALEDLIPSLDMRQDLRSQAVVNSVLGDIYVQLGDREKAIKYLSQSSIADIKSSAKENLSMIQLAEFLFQKGDVKLASVFIKKANEDAEAYGAQQRKIRVGAILPLIEEQIINQVEKQRERLSQQNIMLSVLLAILLMLAIVTYIQLRRLKLARRALLVAHKDLQVKNERIVEVNETINNKNGELNRVNDLLLEANKIKEEYIGFFFTQDADIFEKFKEFKTRIDHNLKSNNLEGIKYLSKAYDLKKEKKKLLQSFDEAFIKLFPDFINEFNSLLKEEEQIEIKKGQLLNKELRIFALIRLGIKHNEIIAQVLGYSVNSIYAYKTKIRNKSFLDKKDFDQMLLEKTRLKF